MHEKKFQAEVCCNLNFSGERLRITLGRQHFAVVWNESFNYYYIAKTNFTPLYEGVVHK